MDVCILSMQRINNMGSVLQSYALKKVLEKIGCNVSFLDIQRECNSNVDSEKAQLVFKGEQEENKFGKFSKIDAYFLNRIKIKYLSGIQDTLFDNFRENELQISKTKKEYDVCIIGSDEVFNCLNTGEWGYTSQLFGNVPEAKRVVTYAASCGATTSEKLPENMKESIKSAFQNIFCFSVRDENTKKFVGNISGRKADINLDPVLIYDFDSELERVEIPKVPKRYCVIYSYYNRIHSKDDIDRILSFCSRNQLTPIAVGAPQFWCKYYVPCNPFQCLKLFNKASYVITDTFHGTIFAAKYSSRFSIIIRNSNQNKLIDLVSRLSIDNHLINSFDELDSNYTIRKDKSVIDRIIESEKENSINYLNRAINEKWL